MEVKWRIGWSAGWLDGQVDGWSDGCVDELLVMDRGMDDQVDGCIVIWEDDQMDS